MVLYKVVPMAHQPKWIVTQGLKQPTLLWPPTQVTGRGHLSWWGRGIASPLTRKLSLRKPPFLRLKHNYLLVATLLCGYFFLRKLSHAAPRAGSIYYHKPPFTHAHKTPHNLIQGPQALWPALP